MSASQSTPFQTPLQSILPFDYPVKGCSGSITLTSAGQVCGPCLQVKAIDAKLDAHPEEEKKLLLIRTEVEESPNQHHDPFTRHLPIEMTSYIFAIYTENFNLDFDPQDPIVENGGPLLLAAVSKSWREIAFGTPHLWNTANILIPSTDNLSTKAELTEQWLDRSRQLPLYLSLTYRESDDQIEPEFDSLVPLFYVLQNVAPRWRNLVLEISPMLCTKFFGGLSCAPTLDTLKILSPLDAEGEFFPRTPSLKHLTIFGLLLSQISIEWSSLTTFHADSVYRDEFFEILQLVEGLDSLRLGGFIADEAEYPLPTSPLIHSALRELYLETGSDSAITPSELETLLDLAVFPSLEKFGYLCSMGKLFPNRALRSLLNRSHCQLTHFDLSGDLENCTSECFISILSDLPTITDLKLEDHYHRHLECALMSDELLQRLTPTRCGEFIQTRLLPRLKSLKFLGYKTFSWSCFANLVSTANVSDSDPCFSQGRGDTTRSICRFSFRLYHGPGTEFIDANSVIRFKGARDAGISINIVNEAPPRMSSPTFPFALPGVNRVYPFDVFP